ncbi:MAG: carbamoyltransferase HypF, partial [Ignavibacteriales bacterium]|nr:carbamoyltransferase HypF [Ignavibacteriales bacterium]
LAVWVNNTAEGVFIEVEGRKPALDTFLIRVDRDRPPRAFIQSLESSYLDPVGYSSFEIRQSDGGGSKTAIILPDVATCPDCLNDILDRNNRRYRYPFTNCTNCGPRFSIIEELPYDRPHTSMKHFAMCPDCEREYRDPAHRRFHAQPNACPACGPQLTLWDAYGNGIVKFDEALRNAADAVKRGKIVAVKGLGGFHLMCDATNDVAVRELRLRKHREEKPFAVMFPSLDSVKALCEVSELEERLLLSPESPIVLLRKKISDFGFRVADLVSAGNPYLGALLPYTPVHHLLMREIVSPVVATSGNLSDEPICIDNDEALKRLHGIADLFLVHDRPIIRHVDDSLVRVAAGRELVLRRARGYAPLPVASHFNGKSILAVGAHLKNSVALSVGGNVFISQHIGDLETEESLGAFKRVIADFERLYVAPPSIIAADLHPDYLSTKFACDTTVEVRRVQHHYAHVASCMLENQLEGSVLGVSWDGTGYGTDGTVWGGEFLLTTADGFDRVATFRTFPLPGGEKAVKEPRRVALGILHELFGKHVFEMKELHPVQAFSNSELELLRQALQRHVNTPRTSSAGRLFDAVASLINLRHVLRHEGQGAMLLEFAATDESGDEAYPIPLHHLDEASPLMLDWETMIKAILRDLNNESSIAHIARKFHLALVNAIVEVARSVGQERIVLTGGCFQNKLLLEESIARLHAAGFKPYWHQRVPPNDGGIALGQLYAVQQRLLMQQDRTVQEPHLA